MARLEGQEHKVLTLVPLSQVENLRPRKGFSWGYTVCEGQAGFPRLPDRHVVTPNSCGHPGLGSVLY